MAHSPLMPSATVLPLLASPGMERRGRCLIPPPFSLPAHRPVTTWLLLTYTVAFVSGRSERWADSCSGEPAVELQLNCPIKVCSEENCMLLCPLLPGARFSLHLANSYLYFRLCLKHHFPRKAFLDLTDCSQAPSSLHLL